MIRNRRLRESSVSLQGLASTIFETLNSGIGMSNEAISWINSDGRIRSLSQKLDKLSSEMEAFAMENFDEEHVIPMDDANEGQIGLFSNIDGVWGDELSENDFNRCMNIVDSANDLWEIAIGYLSFIDTAESAFSINEDPNDLMGQYNMIGY